MTLGIFGVLLAGGIAQTVLLALVFVWRDKRREKRTPHPDLEAFKADVRRLGGWIQRVERESKERDVETDARITKLEAELPARVAALVVNEVMAAISRQRERTGMSEVERALAKAAGKHLEDKE